MSSSFSHEAKVLEDEFFTQENARLLEEMRKKSAHRERRVALRSVVRIEDDGFLDHLIALDIGPETVLALTLMPLVAVAWADGKMQAREREAVLEAAAENGVEPGSPGRTLLEGWLSHEPPQSMFAAWKRYVSLIWGSFDEDEKSAMRAAMLERTRTVAEAAGGLLGLTSKISGEEQAVLDEVDRTLSTSD